MYKLCPGHHKPLGPHSTLSKICCAGCMHNRRFRLMWMLQHCISFSCTPVLNPDPLHLVWSPGLTQTATTVQLKISSWPVIVSDNGVAWHSHLNSICTTWETSIAGWQYHARVCFSMQHLAHMLASGSGMITLCPCSHRHRSPAIF